MRRASYPGTPWRRGLGLTLAIVAASLALYVMWGRESGRRHEPVASLAVLQQAQSQVRPRPSVHTLIVVPRTTNGCALPYSHASYRGRSVAPHGWDIRVQTIHTCIDCPPEADCRPATFSMGSIVQTSGKIVHNEFLTILTAGPGGDSAFCGGFDSYVVTWEAARRVRHTECGGMRTFELQYPITIKIKPKDLMVQGIVTGGTECREMVFCDAQAQEISVTVRKNDALRLEVVVPFRVKE